jgi:nitroreductase
MNVFDAIRTRQSVRAFLNKEIEPEKLRAILESANQAPSAGNLQAYEIHLIRDAVTKQALVAAALDQRFLVQAPVVLIFCANAARGSKYGERGTQLYCIQDATLAVAYAQLAATAHGLATCWVGAFDEEQVARTARLPASHRPVALLPIGYPAETPRRTPRRELEDLVHQH